MKKRIVILLLVLIYTVAFAGCGQTADTPEAPVPADAVGEEKLTVITTIFPQYDFIRAIAGDRVELTMLLPPGTEAHSFEPTPKNIIALESCDLFVYVGGGSDVWVDRILETLDNRDMKALALVDLVDTVEEEIVEGMEDGHAHAHNHEEHDGHDHDHGEHGDHDHSHQGHDHSEAEHLHGVDEHVWTSPVKAMEIVTRLTETLCELDPAGSELYRANAEAYKAELANLDTRFRRAVEEGNRKLLVFGDRFPFRYFADEYGLDYRAAFSGCSSDSEAGAATIAYLIDTVKEQRIPVVFQIEFSTGKIAGAIAEATGAETRLFHSCHNVTRDQMEDGVTYLELMTDNLQRLKEALQ